MVACMASAVVLPKQMASIPRWGDRGSSSAFPTDTHSEGRGGELAADAHAAATVGSTVDV